MYGKTATGMEKGARATHDLSPLKDRDFVDLTAASLSDDLFESEVFGHVRGAFTGALADRPGLVEISLTHTSDGRHDLTVSDDGQGFDPARARERFGLWFVRSLAAQVRGEFTLTSQPSCTAKLVFSL